MKANAATLPSKTVFGEKHLDLEELELDMRLEDLLEKRNAARQPQVHRPVQRRDLVQEALDRLRNRLRMGISAREECERLKQQYPEYAAEIERELPKIMAELRETL